MDGKDEKSCVNVNDIFLSEFTFFKKRVRRKNLIYAVL